MRPLLLLALGGVLLQAAETSDASRFWIDAQTKRANLTSFHQEFDVTHTLKAAGHEQGSKTQIIIDGAGAKWRSERVTGSGNRLSLFDGEELFRWEQGGDEYVLDKKHDGGAPEPSPYQAKDFEWPKARVLNHTRCQVGKTENTCVVLDVPVQSYLVSGSPNNRIRMIGGTERLLLDTDIGLLLGAHSVLSFDNGRGGYSSDENYVLKTMSFGGPAQEALFKLPSADMKQVKELSAWDAKRIRKQLAGKTAPNFSARDIHGNPVSLSSLKGKTVLLDFWTTWCPPCRADAPSLDKLYSKYGTKELAIVGVSVSEDRPIVEKFLQEHPHSFPIVLTSENELPLAYQIGVFPTYIVIDSDGTLSTAFEGERGFAELRSKLKKAGLDTE